jgi:DNA-binding GntR family transcriptional regulator
MRRALPAAAATARLSDEAYNVIKRAIVACELEPGSEVTEAQLCERFGAGKASVRAALVMLAGDGLVRPVARRGYVIAPVTLKDAHDVFDVRSILEPAAARQAVGRVDLSLLRELDAVIRARRGKAGRDARQATLEANRAFHQAIVEACGNNRLARMLGKVLEETERLLHFGSRLKGGAANSVQEHQDLIEAFAAGDADAAEAAARRHIDDGRALILDALLSSPGLMTYQIPLGAEARRRRG